MLILGQKYYFLGPTIFKIPQPNWHYYILTKKAAHKQNNSEVKQIESIAFNHVCFYWNFKTTVVDIFWLWQNREVRISGNVNSNFFLILNQPIFLEA